MECRGICPDVWIELAFKNFSHELAIITDLRLQNEFDKIKSLGGICVLVMNPNVQDTSDAADDALATAKNWDHVLINDGDLKLYNTRVKALVSEIIESWQKSLMDMFEEFERMEPKKRENYIRAPFGWPGGKSQSIEHLLKYFPTNGKTFVDACGGSGIVTLNVPSFYKLKIFNDRHAGVVAFYRCIRDKIKLQQLVERLEVVIHSREEFIWCRDTWKDCANDVERAARWYYMTRMSFGMLGRNFGRSTTGFPVQLKALQNVLPLFPLIHSVFTGVQVENLDCITCARDYDSFDTVHYFDPDYIGTYPGTYEHGVDHVELMNFIHKEAKGHCIVSGYANPLYDSYKWDNRYTWEVSNSIKTAAFTEGNRQVDTGTNHDRTVKSQEVLWIKEPV